MKRLKKIAGPAFFLLIVLFSFSTVTAYHSASREIALTDYVSTGRIADDYINIKSFGAKGNGITDDAKSINKALIYARDKGKVLYFPAGKYAISTSIKLVKSDSIIGESAEKTSIIPITANITCFVLSQQEITLKNISFYNSAASKFKYKAIQLNASNCVIDSIKAFYANMVFYIAEGGCYDNSITNVYAYRVNHGLYCHDKAIFNNNKIEFSACFGSKYNGSYVYQTGDIGARIVGSSNSISSGEWAGFQIGFDIVKGCNNKLSNIWCEMNQYDIKNTAKTLNNIAFGHFQNIEPTGANLLCSENGYGIGGAIKAIGTYGFDIYDSIKGYWIFDDVQEDNSFFDYSFNDNALFAKKTISMKTSSTSFGKTKELTMNPDDSLYCNDQIDFTKPLTCCINASVIKQPNNNRYSVKAFYICKNDKNYVRVILYENSFGVEICENGILRFVTNVFNGGYKGDNNLAFVTFDFPNNRILIPNLSSGKIDEFGADFSGFGKSISSYYVIRAEYSGSDTTEIIVNYAMMWEKIFTMYDYLQILNLKSHVVPLQKWKEMKTEKIEKCAAESNIYKLNLLKSNNFLIKTQDSGSKAIEFENVPKNENTILRVSIILDYSNITDLAFPQNVVWDNNTHPSFQKGNRYILTFVSYDNGVSWLASFDGPWKN